MTTVLERHVEKRFCDIARRRGCLVYKFVSPNQRGVPDRLLITPEGRVVFIEFKRPGGKLTVLQEKVIEKMRHNQADVFVVYSHEDSDLLLEKLERESYD